MVDFFGDSEEEVTLERRYAVFDRDDTGFDDEGTGIVSLTEAVRSDVEVAAGSGELIPEVTVGVVEVYCKVAQHVESGEAEAVVEAAVEDGRRCKLAVSDVEVRWRSFEHSFDEVAHSAGEEREVLHRESEVEGGVEAIDDVFDLKRDGGSMFKHVGGEAQQGEASVVE